MKWGKVLRYLTALVLILFFCFSTVVAQEAQAGPDDPEIREFIRLLNARRQASGCPGLKWDDRLAAVAQAHSRDMIQRNFFSHDNPDGQDPFDRLDKAGIYYSEAAENIVSGCRTGKEAYQSWLNSPHHRINMLNCQYTRLGVGRARGRWTLVLIRPLGF